MTELEQYKSVLADLEKASGWDRDLDTTILTVLLGMQDLGYVYEIDNWYYSRDGDEINPAFPSPTSSFDATIALVERVLPGACPSFFQNVYNKTWSAYFHILGEDDEPRMVRGSLFEGAATPPLALLTALFRAKIAQMEKADG